VRKSEEKYRGRRHVGVGSVVRKNYKRKHK